VQYNIARGRNVDYYTNALGEQIVQIIDWTKEMRLREFAIKTQALPDDMQKLLLENNIQKSIDKQELRIEDAIMIRDIPNIKLANRFLINRRKKYREEKQAEELEKIKTQMEEATKAATEKQQGEQATIQVKTQSIVAGINAQSEADLILQDKKHKDKLEELALTNEYKTIHIKEASEEKFKETALSQAVKQPKVFQEA